MSAGGWWQCAAPLVAVPPPRMRGVVQRLAVRRWGELPVLMSTPASLQGPGSLCRKDSELKPGVSHCRRRRAVTGSLAGPAAVLEGPGAPSTSPARLQLSQSTHRGPHGSCLHAARAGRHTHARRQQQQQRAVVTERSPLAVVSLCARGAGKVPGRCAAWGTGAMCA
jgi:hypothetical protein